MGERCFDTAVHSQAEDRSHNLRQKKDVEVTYFDAAGTVDEMMRTVNEATAANDTVTVADGTIIGKKVPTIKYDDLSGAINNMMRVISQERNQYLKKYPENALVQCQTNLTKVMNEKEN